MTVEVLRDAPADDLTLQAVGGICSGIGLPGRPPLKLAGEQSAFQAGLCAAIAALGKWRRGGRVADLGCGSGVFTDLLRGQGFECVGLDLRTPRTITESLSVRVRPSDSGGRGSRSTQTGVVASHDRRGRYSIPLGDCGEQT